MTHLDTMLARLPSLYREGEIVGGVLAQPATQLETVDEDALDVQRAHHFDVCSELDEAARLAALLDLAPESWQSLRLFRGWVHAMRTALLERGAVTPAAIKGFVGDYARAFADAADLHALELDADWASAPSAGAPAFVETPPRRRVARIPDQGGVEPLQRFAAVNRGLDEAPLALLLSGLPDGPETAPVVANLTTGEALAFLGAVPPGARLWIRAEADGRATARLEGTDVTDRLRRIAPLVPGTPWTPAEAAGPVQALRLARGPNDLWFLPVAHFDAPALERAGLALADLALKQGRWDGTRFDASLFFQEAALALHATWVETAPAAFDVVLPGARLRHRPGRLDAALELRRRLGESLDAGVQRLRAAGVEARVEVRPATEVQGQGDALVAVLPAVHRVGGTTGADRLPDAGGLWNVSDFDRSTYR